MIKLDDMLRENFINTFGHRYYCYIVENKVEVSLESCLNGYDVALYDENQNLLQPKRCTNLKELLSDHTVALSKALEIANQMIEEGKYENRT